MFYLKKSYYNETPLAEYIVYIEENYLPTAW